MTGFRFNADEVDVVNGVEMFAGICDEITYRDDTGTQAALLDWFNSVYPYGIGLCPRNGMFVVGYTGKPKQLDSSVFHNVPCYEDSKRLLMRRALLASELPVTLVKSDDIYETFAESRPGSCMRYAECRPFLKTYADNPDKVGAVRWGNHPLTRSIGSALVWFGSKRWYLDKTYANDYLNKYLWIDYLVDWLTSLSGKQAATIYNNGYSHHTFDRALRFKLYWDGESRMPYMDSLNHARETSLHENYVILTTSSNGVALQSTNGTCPLTGNCEEQVLCGECECECSGENECVYGFRRNYTLCESCASEHVHNRYVDNAVHENDSVEVLCFLPYCTSGWNRLHGPYGRQTSYAPKLEYMRFPVEYVGSATSYVYEDAMYGCVFQLHGHSIVTHSRWIKQDVNGTPHLFDPLVEMDDEYYTCSDDCGIELEITYGIADCGSLLPRHMYNDYIELKERLNVDELSYDEYTHFNTHGALPNVTVTQQDAPYIEAGICV